MKIQLHMRGRDKNGHAKLYRTITEAEFVEIMRLVTARDGLRPWEQKRG